MNDEIGTRNVWIVGMNNSRPSERVIMSRSGRSSRLANKELRQTNSKDIHGIPARNELISFRLNY